MPNRFFAICILVFMLEGFGRHASLRRHEIAPSPATGNELRLDGYWYTIKKSEIRPDSVVTRYFFFKNGKVLFGFNCSPYELNYRESDFTDEFFKQQLTARYNANLTNYAVDGGESSLNGYLLYKIIRMEYFREQFSTTQHFCNKN